MAEEAPGVQNKGMLIVAVVLGLLAVLVYNWQIQRVRAESRGEMAVLVKFARDLTAGTEIDADKDLLVEEIPKRYAAALGDVAIVDRGETPKKFNRFPLNQRVLKGQFLLNSYITHESRNPPSARIEGRDAVARDVPVSGAPGNILSPGDHVNLLGWVSLKGGVVSPERIIEEVKVLAVGGKGFTENVTGPSSYAQEGMAMYRQITIEVSRQASLDLEKVLAHTTGGLRVEVLSPAAKRSDRAGKVNSDVLRNLGAPPASPRDSSPIP